MHTYVAAYIILLIVTDLISDGIDSICSQLTEVTLKTHGHQKTCPIASGLPAQHLVITNPSRVQL